MKETHTELHGHLHLLISTYPHTTQVGGWGQTEKPILNLKPVGFAVILEVEQGKEDNPKGFVFRVSAYIRIGSKKVKNSGLKCSSAVEHNFISMGQIMCFLAVKDHNLITKKKMKKKTNESQMKTKKVNRKL